MVLRCAEEKKARLSSLYGLIFLLRKTTQGKAKDRPSSFDQQLAGSARFNYQQRLYFGGLCHLHVKSRAPLGALSPRGLRTSSTRVPSVEPLQDQPPKEQTREASFENALSGLALKIIQT